ncbi:MAG: protein kinase [Micrococcales bacterium]|nr:protein kinase [Micrococcales bacterium]
MLSGDALSQWLQQQHTRAIRGSLVRLGPSGLPQVSSTVDSHPLRVLLPVLRGGQAAVARVVVDGTQSPQLALRVQAVSSQAERVRQMERLVTMLTVAETTRAGPARYPAVLAVLESFVMALPADQVPLAAAGTGHELWCEVMPWCPTNLAHARDDVLAAGPSAALARLVPLVHTVHAIHEHLNVVHRDITPNNVLLDPAGRLLLADWGIAHTVGAGQTSTRTELIGNRGFSLPPEMLVGDQSVGRYTDAWYLGSLLVWLFTGQPPGPRHGPAMLPGGMPGGQAGAGLDVVARGLCTPDPRQRMGLAEAAHRLDQLRGAGPSEWGPAVPAPPAPQSSATVTLAVAPATPPPPQAVRRWKAFWVPVAVAVALVVVAVGAAAGWRLAHPTNVEPRTGASTSTGPPAKPSCWDDLSAGRCPDVDVWDLGGAFPVKPEVRPPDCSGRDIEDTPGDPSGNWLMTCEWTSETGDQSRAVSLEWFRDTESVAEHYRVHSMFEDTDNNAPPFPDGPDGPVYYRTAGPGILVAYCYAELPVCLETQGDPKVIERTLERFMSLTSREAARLAQSYSR